MTLNSIFELSMTLYYHVLMEISQNNKIRLHLANLIKEACDGGISVQEAYTQISSPPEFSMGHFAFACFPLAKIMRTKTQQYR